MVVVVAAAGYVQLLKQARHYLCFSLEWSNFKEPLGMLLELTKYQKHKLVVKYPEVHVCSQGAAS